MKIKYAALLCVIMIGALLCACGADTEQQTESTGAVKNQTEAPETERQETGPGMQTYLNVHSTDADGNYSPIYTGHVDIEDGVNKYKLFTNYGTVYKQGWEEAELKVMVFNNGSLMDFSADGENYAKSHVFNARNGEDFQREITLRSDDIKYSHGYITVFCMYNPSLVPESGLSSFDGSIEYSFEYDNPNGEEYVFSQTKLGEYLEIPQTWVDEAFCMEVGYKQEPGKYVEDFNHAYNDVTAAEDGELYVKVNLGSETSGNFFLALICDGEIVSLDGENDTVGIVMNNGSTTFQCGIPLSGAEEGLHYYQLFLVQQDMNDAAEMCSDSTYRYRVIIG
ncbi:MAG: hypothetical protein NC223_11050 [Butyrivibrio sp.]|nr:hypothetical protein [Butyrivibrio sp.]